MMRACVCIVIEHFSSVTMKKKQNASLEAAETNGRYWYPVSVSYL